MPELTELEELMAKVRAEFAGSADRAELSRALAKFAEGRAKFAEARVTKIKAQIAALKEQDHA